MNACWVLCWLVETLSVCASVSSLWHDRFLLNLVLSFVSFFYQTIIRESNLANMIQYRPTCGVLSDQIDDAHFNFCVSRSWSPVTSFYLLAFICLHFQTVWAEVPGYLGIMQPACAVYSAWKNPQAQGFLSKGFGHHQPDTRALEPHPWRIFFEVSKKIYRGPVVWTLPVWWSRRNQKPVMVRKNTS